MDRSKLQLLLIDDEPASLAASRAKLTLYVPEKNIHTAVNAVEVMRVMKSIPVQLAFVDVEMPETDGFTIAEYIHRTQPKAQVVFLTGHTELGAKSYDYEPLDFLSKPLDVLRLQRTFERYDRKTGAAEARSGQLALEGANGFILLAPTEILYIAREGRKTILHMQQMTRHVHTSLDELELMLAEFDFFRCHQSFLVPIRQIASVTPADFGRTFTAHLLCGEELPVSRGKYPLLREQLEQAGVHFL